MSTVQAAGTPVVEEAAAAPVAGRALSSDKAQRIVDSMRSSVARRGTAASTFDHVAREAGVSRGLLHYYFGTKEQLLVETVRRDCDLRLAELERRLSTATSAADFVGVMAQDLRQGLDEDPDFMTLIFELFTLARRNADISAEFAGLMRRTREQVSTLLAEAERKGVVRLSATPEAATDVLFALGDGLALRILSEPERDFTDTMKAALACAQAIVSD